MTTQRKHGTRHGQRRPLGAAEDTITNTKDVPHQTSRRAGLEQETS